MTNYNDGCWHGWNGGECPVHPETLVEVMLQSGFNDSGVGSTDWDWGICKNPIIAFRVVKEYKEPREVWLVETDGAPRAFTNKHRAERYAEGYGFAAVLFREVIE